MLSLVKTLRNEMYDRVSITKLNTVHATCRRKCSDGAALDIFTFKRSRPMEKLLSNSDGDELMIDFKTKNLQCPEEEFYASFLQLEIWQKKIYGMQKIMIFLNLNSVRILWPEKSDCWNLSDELFF